MAVPRWVFILALTLAASAVMMLAVRRVSEPVAIASAPPAPVPTQSLFDISYDEFMGGPETERQQMFEAQTPENKAALKRTHAEHWLRRHRESLSPAGRKAMEDVIAYITPDLFTPRDAPQDHARERELLKRLECVVGTDGVREALTFSPTSPAPPKSMLDAAEAALYGWMAWFVECGVYAANSS